MKRLAIIIVAGSLLLSGRAEAWESTTTNAGLAEQAAVGSKLHKRLEEQFGYAKGLFSTLTVPPADAPSLFEILHELLNPIHGYVPDARGQQTALAWLVAGAVVADTPGKHAANHFYNPLSGKGLSDETLRAVDGLRHGLASRTIRERVVRSGVPAIDWITQDDNPMNLAGFHSQYVKAVAAKTPGERSRHLAGTLLAAGAMLHVLQDMASPSHVRNDLAAHLEVIGNDNSDVGSRFERIASIAYSKVGVPAAEAVSRSTLRDYFSGDDKNGLADRTARRFFSAFTLPEPLRTKSGADDTQRANHIAKHVSSTGMDSKLTVDMSRRQVVDSAGVCIADITEEARTATFSIGDDCAVQQLESLLPEAVGYGAGFLDTLFSGSASLSPAGKDVGISVGATALGAGSVRMFWDDRLGVRTEYAKANVKGGKAGARMVKLAAPPADAKRVTVLYEGTDAAGNAMYATGTAAYPLAKPKKAAAK